MVLPTAYQPSDYVNLHKFQGILIVQVFLTLFLFLLLQMIHYVKWGHDEQQSAEDREVEKKPEEGEEVSDKKWDQKAWNVYFPIVFSYHVAAIGLVIIYLPSIFSAVVGFLHFGSFVAMVIVNICIKDATDAEPGKGSRTRVTRIIWAIMCLFNIILIIGGLVGVGNVLV